MLDTQRVGNLRGEIVVNFITVARLQPEFGLPMMRVVVHRASQEPILAAARPWRWRAADDAHG
jgi:hypothetical protein